MTIMRIHLTLVMPNISGEEFMVKEQEVFVGAVMLLWMCGGFVRLFV